MGKFLLTVMEARALMQPGLAPKLGMAKGMARYAGGAPRSASSTAATRSCRWVRR